MQYNLQQGPGSAEEGVLHPGPIRTKRNRMEFAAGIRIALRALARHKLRSGLAMLGISIGVAAFICSVAVGQGASRQVEERIRSLGDNMIWIEAGGRNVNGVRTGTYGTRSLMLGDARAIQQEIPAWIIRWLVPR